MEQFPLTQTGCVPSGCRLSIKMFKVFQKIFNYINKKDLTEAMRSFHL